ncbi:MAG: protein kinase [Gemmatimonadota bacterium]|nr:protein kinase [Gemmatimonadota bacterium]
MTSDLRDQLQSTLASSYTLERELGGGGMSRVFVATEIALGRKVVVKVLPPELAAAVSVERFKREIQLAARLQHSHIVPLLTAGDSDGLPYYTMPLVDGESLRSRLSRGGELPIPEALKILRDTTTALAYAHGQGVVHRDIKPENILVTAHDALVADFGVAKAISASATSAESGLTTLGLALGTSAYMAPEQASGDPAVDHRADLYAWGVLAYELLSGSTPFTGRTPQQLLAAHVSEIPEPLAKRRPGVPFALADLVMRCLEKRPADRPQSADEIVRALDTVATPSGVSRRSAIPATSRYRQAAYAGAAIVVVAVAYGGYVAAHRSPVGKPTHGAAARESSATLARTTTAGSVAVLPFVNVGGRPEEDYFSDGMTDELANALSKVPRLRVASRTSTFAFKGKSADIGDIGRTLKVGSVLEGSVRRDGRKLRIRAQLTDVTDGLALWSESYERELKDVFQVQDEIANAIVGALRLTLATGAPPHWAGGGTESLEAHDLYLRARFLQRKLTEPDLRRSLELYRQALDLDPNYALAWSGIATSWDWLADDWVAPRDAYPIAKEAALKAIALDSTLSDPHAELSLVLASYDWDFAASAREGERAIALNPNDAYSYEAYSWVLSAIGKLDSAMAMAKRAQLLDPLAPFPTTYLGDVLALTGDYTSAIEEYRKALELNSAYSLALLHTGDALLAAGRPAEALTFFRRGPDFGVRGRSGLARALAQNGQPDEARRLAAALERESAHRYIRLEEIAAIYVSLGDTRSAFEWLERAYQNRSAGMIGLKTDPRWSPIRADPRFISLMKKVGLP